MHFRKYDTLTFHCFHFSSAFSLDLRLVGDARLLKQKANKQMEKKQQKTKKQQPKTTRDVFGDVPVF